jgi:GNAT superfamily N-acetyltransferase
VSFTVRAAEPGEEARVVPLYEWLFAPPGSVPPSWDERRAAVALRQAIDSHDCTVILAEGDDGELIGLCTGYLDLHSVRYGYRVWVEDLAVHPEHRSQGVGKALLDAAKAWARERGATHLELDSAETRTDAHRFYEREQPTLRSISFAWRL